MENEYKGSLYAVRPVNSLTIIEDMYYLVKQYDSNKDNSTSKTKLHFDINTLLSKVIEFVEFNKVSNSDYNDIERYFKKLVEVRNELEPEINTEENKQLSNAEDFYKIVGKRISDSEQPKQPINENWSDSLQAILSNKKSNLEKDKEILKIHGQNFYLNSKDDNTRYTLAFKIADGTVYKRKEEYPNFGIPLIRAVFKNEIDLLKTELENKDLQEKEIKKEVDKYINKFRGYLNSTLRDKDNSSNDLFKKDMFSENQKDTKEMWLNVIEHLNKCNIPICEIFKEEFKKTYKQNI